MDTALTCENLTKRYPNQEKYALGDVDSGVSFEVNKGELFALLGPSGCGKTTTLRIIGGFVQATSGTVVVDGVDVTRNPPYARPTNTMFQSYALFPNMDVAANVAFGLKMDRVPRAERDARVAKALELVGMTDMGKRRVSELSGGQQQRAALARAIIKEPAVLLLDEPFGALDLKLRHQLQEEVVRLKELTGTTFVHVTHDQEEACAVADRIAVMREGKIVQVDTPLALYRSPSTAYVAEFLHAGTIVRGEVSQDNGFVKIAHPDLALSAKAPAGVEAVGLAALLPRDSVHVLPDDAVEGSGPRAQAKGIVQRMTFTGTVFEIHVLVGSTLEIRVTSPVEEVAALGAESLAVGRTVQLAWRSDAVVILEDS